MHDADHAGRSHAPVNLNAPFGQLAGHQVCRADFLKAQFGMRVDITAQGGDGSRISHEGINDLHGGHLFVKRRQACNFRRTR